MRQRLEPRSLLSLQFVLAAWRAWYVSVTAHEHSLFGVQYWVGSKVAETIMERGAPPEALFDSQYPSIPLFHPSRSESKFCSAHPGFGRFSAPDASVGRSGPNNAHSN